MSANAEHYLGDLVAAAKIIPAENPYVMMNLMKYKPQARYPASYHGSKPESSTGREAYLHYKDHFLKRATELGVPAEILFLGKAHTQIAAGPQEGENFDVALLVKFKNFADFRTVLDDEQYLNEIQPHRIAALQEFRSFSVTEMSDF